MKRGLMGVLSVGLLVGTMACGVDKQGTANNLIKSIEKQAGTTLTSDQKACLQKLINSYSDDLIKRLDKSTATAEETTAFGQGLLACDPELATLGNDTATTTPNS